MDVERCTGRRIYDRHVSLVGFSLTTARYMNVIPLIRLFITNGLDVDEKDNDGFTPLHRAVFGKCEDAAIFLIASGADINVKNRNGHTPAGILKRTVLRNALKHV